MKVMKRINILILSVALLVGFSSTAFCALSTQVTTDVELIDVDKTAPGTKLSGPLTIYYVETFDGSGIADMYIFLRLRKGYDLHAFSTKIENVPYSPSTIDAQQTAIDTWIETEVIPELYCTEIDPYNPGTCLSPLPPFAIKSTDQMVQDNSNCVFCTDLLYFTIMDVVIAVQD